MKLRFYNELFKKKPYSYCLGIILFKSTKIGYQVFPYELAINYIFGRCGIIFGKVKEEE